MAETPQKKQLKSMPLLADNLTKAISELDQRIKDLEDFDVKTIAGRFDTRTKELEDKVNETLSDIFGQNSAEYRKNSILTLDPLPIVFGGSGYSLSTMQLAYQEGINDYVTRLKSLKETLEQKPPDTNKIESQP